MGMDPLKDCKFIRLAHELGLGCGDVREIEIVGDLEAGKANWHFIGPFKEMTFASSMQHKIYWGRLKGPIEWSLKTWLAPWAYIASVIYHDLFWYPFNSRAKMRECLTSVWGRLFQNWGNTPSNAEGFPEVGEAAPRLKRNLLGMIWQSIKVLGTCIVQAPEFKKRKKT